jgi:S-adenosylmethionine:tRNA ribosyltransferase-isomerase
VRDARTGERIDLPGGVVANLDAAHPDPARSHGSRLWRAHVPVKGGVERYLGEIGRPITYDYLDGHWPLAAYQTIFAREPGSAEMPSAARPFSAELVADLVTRGVMLAPLTLHTGVSSLEADEPPLEERYQVPATTARLVNATRRAGGRVIAVGTTAARALETVAEADGRVRPGSGWTDLVLGPHRTARVVRGLVTGWHDPAASHVLLLQAVAGSELVERAYAEALAERYRWHEFGDSSLLLP